MEYIKLVEKKFSISNLESELRRAIKEAETVANNNFLLYNQNTIDVILEIQGGFKSFNHQKEHRYNQVFLSGYVNSKNKLFELAKSPLYSIYHTYKETDLYIEQICSYLYNFKNIDDFENVVTSIKNELSNIEYNQKVVDFPKTSKNFTEDLNIKNKIADFNTFEQAYIKSLEGLNIDLENDYFKQDDLFVKYSFNLNVVSIALIYQMFLKFNLFEGKMSFGKFCHLLYPNSIGYIKISVAKSDLKVQEFGYFLQLLLNSFWNGNRKEFLDYLGNKFEVEQSPNRFMIFGIKESKHIIRLDDKSGEEPSNNRKIILTYINDIKKLHKNINL